MTQFWGGFKVWPCQQKGIFYLSRFADDNNKVHHIQPYWGRHCDCDERGGLWQDSPRKVVCQLLLFVSIIFISGLESAPDSDSYIQNLNTHTPEVLKAQLFTCWCSSHLLLTEGTFQEKKYFLWNNLIENARSFSF